MQLSEDTVNRLQTCQLFKKLDKKDVYKLLEQILFRKKSYNPEQYIVYSDDPCNDLIILISGSIRGEMNDFSGKKIKIEDIKSPSTLASAFIFGPENRFPVDIITNEKSEVIIIPRNSLIRMFSNNSQILKNFLDSISGRAQFLTKKIRFLTFKTIREKIAQYLIQLSIKQGSNRIILPYTQTKLADLFGVTRPSLARTFSEMEKEGIIKSDRNKIEIIKKNKLVYLLNE
ncbi:MAG: Crp/Fnr family transcriptional regulator [Bacteroidales bacterium]|nr:Crp/Fnr family transcriptional regulator [Bacteroidales bacterium]